MNKISIINIEPRQIASIKSKTTFEELANTIQSSFNSIYKVINDLPKKEKSKNIVVYLDQEMNIEVGVEVNSTFDDIEDIIFSCTPSGKAAITTHIGPYNELHKTHELIQNYCLQNNIGLSGKSCEIYGDWQDDQSKLETTVYYQIKQG